MTLQLLLFNLAEEVEEDELDDDIEPLMAKKSQKAKLLKKLKQLKKNNLKHEIDPALGNIRKYWLTRHNLGFI